jgi:pimeloyl-ACP methyl ester carboxylesterase
VTQAFQLSRLAPNNKGLEPAAASRLEDVSVPTLVMLGDQDAPDIQEIGQFIHKGVAGSQLVTIPDAGHSLMMERPGEFNRLLEAFLAA